MKLFVTVKPNAKVNLVERIDDNHFRVFVKAQPQDGKANEALVKALSEYFKIPQSCFSILSGENRKTKVIQLN